MTGNAAASEFEVVIHGSDPGPDVVSAAQRGLGRINAPSDTSVTFTSSFVDDVRQATGDANYSTARGAGVVGGISVPKPAGGSAIFINTTESERFDSAEIERLLAHEGGHALLHSRSEAWREHDKNLIQHEWQWLMMLLGGVAAEEYRIESALRELGYGPSESSSDVDHMEDTLHLLNLGFLEAVVEPNEHSPADMAVMITREQSILTKALAYAAAFTDHPEASIPDSLSTSGARHWRDYVGPLWSERNRAYAAIPNALHTITENEYKAQLQSLYTLEMKQLSRIGFERSGTDATEQFIRIATVNRCNERFQAAS
ncbi:hypothetical protein ACIGB8_14760 [Promicromonospora sukumoe]|uniref:hypothetical protein n=1 Tax=Promicromonospora sukumoe TaxID=88382 RepID=UPI0037CB6C58